MKDLRIGARVRLVSTTDPYTKLRPGALGTVKEIGEDIAGTGGRKIYVKWDCGSNLALLECDGFEVVKAK